MMPQESKYSFLEVKAKLEALCSYQERCSYDLDKKMIGWGVPKDDRDALLAHLISTNFLSEERFAEAYVSGKYRIKKWGRIKIKNGLKLKRISNYSIQKGLDIINGDEYWNNLTSLTERKLLTLKDVKNDYPTRVKLYRFLSGRGYEQDLIKDAVEEIISQELS